MLYFVFNHHSAGSNLSPNLNVCPSYVTYQQYKTSLTFSNFFFFWLTSEKLCNFLKPSLRLHTITKTWLSPSKCHPTEWCHCDFKPLLQACTFYQFTSPSLPQFCAIMAISLLWERCPSEFFLILKKKVVFPGLHSNTFSFLCSSWAHHSPHSLTYGRSREPHMLPNFQTYTKFHSPQNTVIWDSYV